MNTDRFKFRVLDKIKSLYWKEGTANLCGDGTPFFIDASDMQPHKLEDAIVEQCTGLRDKNGKLIYEGDVVQGFVGLSQEHQKGRVFW